MSALEYIKEAAELPQTFKNGTIRMLLRPEGIIVRGTVELPPEEGALTFHDHLVAWQVIEYSNFNPLIMYHKDLVDDLKLEAEDAGS